MTTRSPSVRVRPASGSLRVTKPAACSAENSCLVSGRSPASVSVRSAEAWARPTTFGTSTVRCSGATSRYVTPAAAPASTRANRVISRAMRPRPERRRGAVAVDGPPSSSSYGRSKIMVGAGPGECGAAAGGCGCVIARRTSARISAALW